MHQKLCKRFGFEEANRSRLVFSDPTKIRLVPPRLGDYLPRLQLKSQGYKRGRNVYSLDTDLTVTTWISNPETLASWAGFEAIPAASQQPAGTSVRYKLNDGTDDRFWDGGAWAVAGATDWNTEAEVTDNIASFPSTSRRIGVVVNLVTTDEFETPTLQAVEFLMDCEIDYIKSLVADSLAPSLAEGIRHRVDITTRAPGGSLVSLKALELDYNIVSVSAVYLDDTDPTHETNVLDSFDTDSQNAALTVSPERGVVLWLELLVEPEVYVNWASQDYYEVEKIPCVLIENFDIVGNEVSARQSVINSTAKTASVRRAPFRLRITLDVVLLAEKNRTLLTMLDKAMEHASTTHRLPWRAVDEVVSLTMVDEGAFAPKPNLSDKHDTRYSLRLDDVYLWLRPEEELPLVERLNISLASPELEGGPRTGA